MTQNVQFISLTSALSSNATYTGPVQSCAQTSSLVFAALTDSGHNLIAGAADNYLSIFKEN